MNRTAAANLTGPQARMKRVLKLALILAALFLSCENPAGDENNHSLNTDPVDDPATITLTATAKGTTAISVTWTAVETADMYVLYRAERYSVSGDYYYEDFIKIHESSTNDEYIDGGLFQGTSYRYKIEAKLQDELIVFDAQSLSTVKEQVTIINKAVSSNSVQLKWKPINGSNYHIDFMSGPNNPIASGVELDTADYTISVLSSNSTYIFQIKATRKSSDRLYSADTVLVTITTTLPAPQNVTAAATGRVVTLSWDAVDAAAGYAVYASFNESGPYIPIVSHVPGTACFITTLGGGIPLEGNKGYFFKTAAKKAEGTEGDLSAAVPVTTGS